MGNGWDSKDLAEEFAQFSTAEMIRVVRIITPPEDAYKWVVTAPGRSWEQVSDDWVSTNTSEPESPHCYDDDFMRYLLGEQIVDYGLYRGSLVWQRH